MYEVKDFDPTEWEVDSSNYHKPAYIRDENFRRPSEWDAEAIIYKYKGPEKHYWNQTRINIYKDGSNEEWIHFNRNYCSVPNLCYVKQNEKEYIITSGDYQCLTIINLTEKKINSYCYGDHDRGLGFCPIDIDVDIDDNEIVDITIEGCYWGGPFEKCRIEGIKNLDEFEFPEDLEFYDDYDE